MTFEFNLRTPAGRALLSYAAKYPNTKYPYTGRRFGKPALYIVKDRGVYLMNANAENTPTDGNRDTTAAEFKNVVVYAKEWGENSCISGDDWAELIPLPNTNDLLNITRIKVTVSESCIEIKISSTKPSVTP